MNKIKKYIMAFNLIFITPLLVNIMLCYMFSDHQLKETPTAVYLGDNTQFSRSIVSYFDDNETFDVKYYVDSPYDIEKLIAQNKVKFGLVIPDNFYKDLKQYKSPTILTVYDGSQLASTSFAKAQAAQTLMTIKGGALIKVLQAKLNLPFEQAKKIVSSISIQTRMLFNPTRNYTNYLMPGFMAAIVQAGLVIAASVSIDREKRRSMATYLGSKILVYTILGFISLMLNIFIQINVFDVPFRGSIKQLMTLSFVYCMTIATIGIFISSLVWDKVKASQAAAVIFLPNTIMIGYTYPLIGMPDGYKFVGKYIPLYHYADNLRDLMIKGYIINYAKDIRYLLSVSILFFGISIIVEVLRENRINKKKSLEEGEIIENN